MDPIIPRDLIQHLEWKPGQEIPPLPAGNPASREQGNVFSIDTLIKSGKPFYSEEKDSNNNWIGVAVSLRQAAAHAGTDGIVASLPYLLAGKVKADKSNYLWKTWLTALSEENVGISEGRIPGVAEAGEPVLAVVHGGGVLRTYDRIMKAYADGLTPQNAAKLAEEEFNNSIKGKFEKDIPVYTVDDLKNGINPFGRYVILVNYETAKATKSGYHSKPEFMNNDLVIARAGTLEYLDEYFEKAKGNSGDAKDKVGSWHRFAEIDPQQPQGRVLFLDGNYDGLYGYDNLYYDGRFVGVAPEAHGAKK